MQPRAVCASCIHELAESAGSLEAIHQDDERGSFIPVEGTSQGFVKIVQGSFMAVGDKQQLKSLGSYFQTSSPMPKSVANPGSPSIGAQGAKATVL